MITGAAWTISALDEERLTLRSRCVQLGSLPEAASNAEDGGGVIHPREEGLHGHQPVLAKAPTGHNPP